MSPADARRRRARRLTALNAILALLAIVLVVQMWLLTATLESYLAGHHEAALPGALVSGALFLTALALLYGMRRIER